MQASEPMTNFERRGLDLLRADLAMQEAASEWIKNNAQPDGLPPVVEGGQGHDADDILDAAVPLGLVAILAVLLIVAFT